MLLSAVLHSPPSVVAVAVATVATEAAAIAAGTAVATEGCAPLLDRLGEGGSLSVISSRAPDRALFHGLIVGILKNILSSRANCLEAFGLRLASVKGLDTHTVFCRHGHGLLDLHLGLRLGLALSFAHSSCNI